MMISGCKNRVGELLVKKELAEKIYQREMISEDQAKSRLDTAEEAQRIAQGVSQAVQQKVHDRVAGVVTRCLEAVFDDPYEFRILFEQKRGRTEANLVFIRDGMELDPMTAAGGGVVDLASFALRLSCLMLARPAVRRTVVLDEPFRFVSVEYRANIRAMLEGLSNDLGVQFIMVTHMDDLKIGKVIEIE